MTLKEILGVFKTLLSVRYTIVVIMLVVAILDLIGITQKDIGLGFVISILLLFAIIAFDMFKGFFKKKE